MRIGVNPKFVFLILLASIGLLVTAHCLVFVSVFLLPSEDFAAAVRMFSLDHEANVPSWFSSGILMLSGSLLLLIGLGHRSRSEPWLLWALLALVFVFLSLDELAVIHEGLGRRFGDLLNAEGIVREYAWVLPYGLAAIGLGLSYLPFLFRIPARQRILVMVGGCVYILGAVGVELATSLFWNPGELTWQYYALVTLEESCEMAGIAIFVLGLLEYMKLERLTVAFSAKS